MKEIDKQLKVLPTAQIAGKAWEDYGQVILCKDNAEMVKEADRHSLRARTGDDTK